MMNWIIRCRAFIELWLKTRNAKVAVELAGAGVWPFYISRSANGLWLTPLDLSLATARKWPWLLKNLDSAIALKQQVNANFCERQGYLGIDIHNLKLVASTGEEIFTATEVFIENVYRFFPPRPVVILDIGMNVGYASLQFASMPEVIAVYSFEPFPKTYEQALSNIQLNSSCAAKIRTENVGIGGNSRTMTVAYDIGLKGSASIYNETSGKNNQEQIRLRGAMDVLNSITTAHPGFPIVAKIDCEGSEYEILKAWVTNGCLPQLSIIMIEWHRMADWHNPEKLRDWLVKAGFNVFAREKFSGNVGMLYATRDSSQINK